MTFNVDIYDLLLQLYKQYKNLIFHLFDFWGLIFSTFTHETRGPGQP